MGKALQVINGFVTAPSTTFTAWTLATGDSLTVRNAKDGTMVRLLNMWAVNQSAGALRVRSALLHDDVIGIEHVIPVDNAQLMMALGSYQRLQPQDTLTVTQTGSATASDIEMGTLLVQYDDLPGADARLVRWSDIKGRIESYYSPNNTLATGTGRGYSGEEAINAEDDQFKNNRDYAILGYTVSAQVGCIGYRGSDTGNLRVGGPANVNLNFLTAEWFKMLAIAYDLPLIPVFNASNKGSLLVDTTQDEDGADVTVSHNLALIAGPGYSV